MPRHEGLLLALIFCISLTLSNLKHSTQLVSPVDWDHQTPFHSRAHSIIRQSYDNTFAYVVENCPPQQNFRTCLTALYRHSEGPSWPWWFRTLLRDGAAKANQLGGPWHWKEFANGGTNVQVCAIEENGAWPEAHCEYWKQRGQEVEVKGRGHCTFDSNARVTDRIVWIRDPLERFLDAFLDVCVHHRSLRHCQPAEVFMDWSDYFNPRMARPPAKLGPPPEPLIRTSLEGPTLFQAFVDTLPLTWDLYFVPQAFHCDGVYRHPFDVYKWQARKLEQRFPFLKEPLQTIGAEPDKEALAREYYTPQTLHRVLQYTAIDYLAFKLPIPSWVEEVLAQEAIL